MSRLFPVLLALGLALPATALANPIAKSLGNLRWGVSVARRAWLQAEDVLNTQPLQAFRSALRRHRN